MCPVTGHSGGMGGTVAQQPPKEPLSTQSSFRRRRGIGAPGEGAGVTRSTDVAGAPEAEGGPPSPPSASPPPPSPGQLVTVRNRQWTVAEVTRSSIAAADPVRAVSNAAAPHLVTLVSIEDDARDEELRVVWELEHKPLVHDQEKLPSPGGSDRSDDSDRSGGFDDPARLDAFLDAVRWGATTSADRTALQAPFRSGIELEDYQLDPVVRALSMPRTNLLIADDVGLGKTVEAGLVMQELMLRHRARSMLIVCPAGLTLQWQEEMRDKFGLDFRIVDSALLRELRRSRGLYTNPWTHYPRLIVSVDWLKRERPMRMLRELLPPVPEYPRVFDLLVIDEVHTCAPSGTGKYAVDSQRTAAVRTLAPHCEHRLFLSATPHNGFLESFTALLELLDNRRFARGVRPSREQLARVMVRRMKSDLPPRWDGRPRFPRRVPHALEVSYAEETRAAYEKLSSYARSRAAGAGGRAEQSAADFVTTLLKKRFLSSPKAFAETIDVHLETMTAKGKGLPSPSNDTPTRSAERVLRPLFEQVEETAETDEEHAEAAQRALTAVRGLTRPLSEQEAGWLRELSAWARSAARRPDAKFATFRAWLEDVVCPTGPAGGAEAWTDERVIVFTEYRDTQRWLYERLLAAQFPADRIALLFGGQRQDEREHVKTVFQEDPALSPVRILLATDTASEGINLQAHCHRLLHWEIPWNPNRLEQRNGRVDRHGQRADQVDVFHFVPEGWRTAGGDAPSGSAPAAPASGPDSVSDPASDPDSTHADGTLEDELHFLAVAARKTERIREDLGSAGEVIAAQVEQKMLGRRSDWTTAEAEIRKRSSRAALKVERDHARELEKLVGALAESRETLHLTPATVERVVRTALHLAHRKDLTAVPDPAVSPRGDGSGAARCFRLPELPGAWAHARNEGLHHPLTGRERPVVFDEAEARGRTDVVLLHLGHRLVQMCLRLLRAELWSGGQEARLSRVTAKTVPDTVLRTPAVVAHGRVVISGSGGTRLHEEIITAGGRLSEGKLEQARQTEIDTWLGAAVDQLPSQQVRSRLTELWPRLEERLSRALRNRASTRFRSLETLLAKRCEEEVEGVRAVLADLERSIRERLDDTTYWEQGSLFDIDDERRQLHADREALTERLRALPQLVESETEALRRRWADPTPRWFPVAVTFLVPHSLARGGRL
ncbi:DISARM system SNF2-like helicase DrmD [Streptomyces sp. GSL17-113]|uniref:DISARM system SNF2-like helicase DrmD n=2 Tax=unclassified Streptomyces TaxID=2593676 RepID=UPI002E7A28DA|nr:DISARM system SNF2-like helicase DrmD [Streptomyces sp. GSL17-113]